MTELLTKIPTWYPEWSLLLFTVFAQFAVGAGLFASIVTCFKDKRQTESTIPEPKVENVNAESTEITNNENIFEATEENTSPVNEEKPKKKEKVIKEKTLSDIISTRLWIFTFFLMGIAGIISLLHLQNPFNAFYTITRVATSWLSREIICVGIFTGLVFLRLIKADNRLSWIASLSGLLLVLSISQVYNTVEAMPFWTSINTVFTFYGTTLVLGSASGLMFGSSLENLNFKRLAKFLLFVGAVFSLSSVANLVRFFLLEENLHGVEPLLEGLFHLYIQVGCILFGLLLLFAKRFSTSSFVLFIGLLFLLAGELASRTIFFLAQFKIGV